MGEVEARMTHAEESDLKKAFERDKWAGEWNSLPTAIDRLLAARAAAPDALRVRIEALAAEWETTICDIGLKPTRTDYARDLRDLLEDGAR